MMESFAAVPKERPLLGGPTSFPALAEESTPVGAKSILDQAEQDET